MEQLAANLQGYAHQANISIPNLEYLGLTIQGDRLIAFTDFEGSGTTVATGDFQKLAQLHDQLMTPNAFPHSASIENSLDRLKPSNAAPKRSLSPQQQAKRERSLRRAQRHHAKKQSRNAAL